MRNIMTASVLAMLTMGAFAASAHAAKDGQAPSTGVVKFKGSVVESPCFVSLESAEQTIPLGDIAKSQLEQTDGRSPAKPFQIKLEKCDTSSSSAFNISFKGTTKAKEELSVAEPERGVAVVINDKDGKKISFDGSVSADIDMADGTNILDFTAYVKKASGAEVTPGDFTAETNFQIDYK